MAPKNKFSKQQLVDAAFCIACEEGMSGITIRKIADRLGSSIAPIYCNYKDVEELKSDVVKKAYALQMEIFAERKTGNAFLDLGVTSVIFARTYPRLFDDIVLKNNLNASLYEKIRSFSIEKMKTEPMLSQFSDQELDGILMQMEAFQIGLSVLAGRNTLSERLTDEKILDLLRKVGSMVIQDMEKYKL